MLRKMSTLSTTIVADSSLGRSRPFLTKNDTVVGKSGRRKYFATVNINSPL